MEFKIRKKSDDESGEERQEDKKASLGKTHDVVRTALTETNPSVEHVGERYEVKGVAGRGGMGIVQAVEDTVLDRTLALKVMYQDKASDVRKREAFTKEAIITAQLQHPNIIPVHDMGTLVDEDAPFYTMKLVDGESLQDILVKIKGGDEEYRSKFNRFHLLSIFRKVCDAVSYAHSKGVIHRDIKPENIMIGQFGEVLLLDWGLAKYHDEDKGIVPFDETASEGKETEVSASGLKLTDGVITDMGQGTMDGIIKGSLSYMSPEQAMGWIHEVGYQTDVFLLGATLYHILTWSAPYEAKTTLELVEQAEKTKFIHPRKFEAAKDCPNTLIDIVLKAMAHKKADRYTSTEELTDALDKYLTGATVSRYQKYSKGEVLIRDGEIDHDTFVLVSGAVEVFGKVHGRSTLLTSFEKGAIFGELAGISHDARSATVKAKDDCEVLVIGQDLLKDVLGKLPPWMEYIVFSMAKKLNRINKMVHPYSVQECTYPVLRQLYYIFASLILKTGRKESLYVDWDGLCYEISNNLAVEYTRVEGSLEKLLKAGVISMNGRRLTVECLEDVEGLITFIKRELNLRDGLALGTETIDREALKKYSDVYNSFFDEV